LVGEDKEEEGTAEKSLRERQGTAEQVAEQAARRTAVAGDGGSRAEMRETWKDVFPQVKISREISVKQPVRRLKRAGGSTVFASSWHKPSSMIVRKLFPDL
jgi:hypothetical protein